MSREMPRWKRWLEGWMVRGWGILHKSSKGGQLCWKLEKGNELSSRGRGSLRVRRRLFFFCIIIARTIILTVGRLDSPLQCSAKVSIFFRFTWPLRTWSGFDLLTSVSCFYTEKILWYPKMTWPVQRELNWHWYAIDGESWGKITKSLQIPYIKMK